MISSGIPTLAGQRHRPIEGAGQHQRRRRILHRVDVEQEIGGVDERAQGPGAGKFDRLARAVEGGLVPQPVEILVDKARDHRIARIETAIGGDIVEGQGQHSPARPQPGAEQPVEGDGPADLVAMGQCRDQHMRPRDAAVEGRDIVDPDIAGTIGLDIGWGQLDGVVRLGHKALP